MLFWESEYVCLTPRISQAGLLEHCKQKRAALTLGFPGLRKNDDLQQACWMHLSKCAATVSTPWLRPSKTGFQRRRPPPVLILGGLLLAPLLRRSAACCCAVQGVPPSAAGQLVDPEGDTEAKVAAARHLVQLCARGGAARVQAGLRSVRPAVAC